MSKMTLHLILQITMVLFLQLVLSLTFDVLLTTYGIALMDHDFLFRIPRITQLLMKLKDLKNLPEYVQHPFNQS